MQKEKDLFFSIFPFSAVLGDGYGGHSSSGIGTACIVKVQSIEDMVAAAMGIVLAIGAACKVNVQGIKDNMAAAMGSSVIGTACIVKVHGIKEL